ncbi:MAG: hypothetical protein JSS63_07295 [Bacteroidetes bacterium]|nr:hypothetical protein [Bacteroidota bacterium]
MKSFLSFLLVLLFLSSALIYTSGCKDNAVTTADTTTIANPNVKVYRNLTINEFFGDASMSSINLDSGTITLANSIWRDAELSDSVGQGRDRFYIRSGDGNQDHLAPGQETKFVPFFNTRSATYSQAAFDTTKRIDPSHADPLVATDFYKYSTYSLGRSFVSDDIRVYGFWLKGKKVSMGWSTERYGLVYLKSIATTTIGGVSTYQLTVDVKLNTAGQNDFRERIPSN